MLSTQICQNAASSLRSMAIVCLNEAILGHCAFVPELKVKSMSWGDRVRLSDMRQRSPGRPATLQLNGRTTPQKHDNVQNFLLLKSIKSTAQIGLLMLYYRPSVPQGIKTILAMLEVRNPGCKF